MVLSCTDFNRLFETGRHDDILRTLPQYHSISPNRFDWFESLSQDEFQDPYGHYQALFGIGGAESVVCVQAKIGLEGDSFHHLDALICPERIFSAKTLNGPLFRFTTDISMDNRAKTFAKRLFLEASRAKEEVELYQHLRQNREYPWFIGTPDLLARVDGELWVVVIKAPHAVSSVIPFSYVTELHYFYKFCALNGITPDRLVLVAHDKDQGRILPLDVKIDESLLFDILEGGSAFWKIIISGRFDRFEKIFKK